MAGIPRSEESRIDGLKEAHRAIRRAGDEGLVAELKVAHKKAADLVLESAQPPHVSGLLEGSMRSSSSKTSGRVAVGRKAIPYAGPIHFGWPQRNISPQPFLYDALDRRRKDVLELFEDAVGRIVHKIDRTTPS